VAAFRTTTRAAGFSDRLLVALASGLTCLAGLQLWSLLRLEPFGMDFLPLWAAGRMVWTEPGKVYDFAAVTAAQAWLLPPHFAWLRPYAYPPATLLLMAPLGRLPFWAAAGVWSALSLGVFLYATVRLIRRNNLLAVLLTAALPAVVIAATAGQTVVLTSGLVVLAVLELDRRPRFAGCLLALAAIAKPQAVIMAPVALLACGGLEALASAGVVAIAAAAASAVFFGPDRWSEWLASLPAFQRVIEGVPALEGAVITPFWAARELGLHGPSSTLAEAAFALAGAGLVWTLFRNPAKPAHRIAALALGSLVAAPYAMCYDATAIAPAATALGLAALERGALATLLLALAAAFEATAPYLGLPALLVFAGLVIADWRSAAGAGARSTAVAALP